MITPDVENFASCYVEMLQVAPQRMQTEISSYLQSDLQHQRLMELCKQHITELQTSSSSQDRRRLVQQLIFCLSAIQDICDRRAPIINEVHEVLELKTQTLLALQTKFKSEGMQSCASGTETNMESEVDMEELDVADESGVIHRSATLENTTKHVSYDGVETGPQTRVASCRRKSRLSQRITPDTSRLSGARHSLGRMETTSIHCKPGPHPIGKRKSMFRSIKRRCAKESHLREHACREVRHRKLTGTYPRYARARQQRQQQRQHFKKQRSLSAVEKVDSIRVTSMRERRHNVSEPITGPRYLKTGRRLGYRVSRLDVSCRSSNRTDWANTEQYYFDDDDQNTRSASSDSVEGGRGKASAISGGNRSNSVRTFGPQYESPWPNQGVHSSDELYESENTDDNDTEAAPLHIREIRPYYGRDQGPVTSSSSFDPKAARSKVYHVVRRALYRQRKSMDASGKSEPAPLDGDSAQDSDLQTTNTQRQPGSPTCVRDTGLLNKRRDKNPNVVRQYHKSSTSYSPDQPLKHTISQASSPRFKGALGIRSPIRHASDISDMSPDERLYCLCKKVSFGDMIACDNKRCTVEWFHFACVDIRVQPKGKWYCPLCRGDSSKVKRTDV